MSFRQNLKHFISDTVFKAKNFKVEDSILIFSVARGGSTWLMELLTEGKNNVINWEPAHKQKGLIYETLPFDWTLYIPKENTEEKYCSLFKDILTLNKSNNWTLKYVKPKDLWKANQVVTKFVRANNLLPWLTENFQFQHKPILLVRHPIAVAFSLLKAFGGDMNQKYEGVEIPEVQFNEIHKKYEKAFQLVNSKLTFLVAEWALNNVEVLKNEDDKWHVVFYEDLLLNPEKEIEQINNNCNLNISLDENTLREASSSSRSGDYKRDTQAQLDKWKNKLPEEEKERIQQILDAFGIKVYNVESSLPQK